MSIAGVGGYGQQQDKAEATHYFQYIDLSHVLLDVERQTMLRLRNAGRINDEVAREIEHELDLNETRLVIAKGHERSGEAHTGD